jgi:protein-S-isoprenylcysteine O-methyltransferase Ste14
MAHPQGAIFIAWDLWFASWMIAALWADRAARRVPLAQQALHWALVVAGFFLLLGIPVRPGPQPGRFWVMGEAAGWGFVALACAGLGLCWWARLHLGRLWSGAVTRKADHHVVDTGPYAIVRHPIYSGLILASLATAILRGTILCLAGAGLVALGFWIKARQEERFLREELGAEAYDSYRRRTPMLIPGLRRAI